MQQSSGSDSHILTEILFLHWLNTASNIDCAYPQYTHISFCTITDISWMLIWQKITSLVNDATWLLLQNKKSHIKDQKFLFRSKMKIIWSNKSYFLNKKVFIEHQQSVKKHRYYLWDLHLSHLIPVFIILADRKWQNIGNRFIILS